MTTRTIQITQADIDAIVALRPAVADAAHHPGRAAAVEAIDRLASVKCDGGCRCNACCRAFFDKHYEHAGKAPDAAANPFIEHETDLRGMPIGKVPTFSPGQVGVLERALLAEKLREIRRNSSGVPLMLDTTGPATKVRPLTLIDFIERVWPTLYPDRPLQRTPHLEQLCSMIDDAGAASPVVQPTATGNFHPCDPSAPDGVDVQHVSWRADMGDYDGIWVDARRGLYVAIERPGATPAVVKMPLPPRTSRRRIVGICQRDPRNDVHTT